MAEKIEYGIVQDARDGHRHLDPIPASETLDNFYQSEYYHLLQAGGRAPDLRKLLSKGEEAQREGSWLQKTQYNDIVTLLKEYAPGKRVLDVGCGVGHLLSHLDKEGLDPMGVEPSKDAVAIAIERGTNAVQGDLASLVEARTQEGLNFDAVLMLNVLEHVPDPDAVLADIRRALRPGGVVLIRVPNDFSEIQEHALAHTGNKPWWIAVPDHIQYFTFQSLAAFLERNHFDVCYAQGDFPMELFLLLGDNYIGDPSQGSACHKRRVGFELALPGDFRRDLYRALATVGVGRNCFVVARLREEKSDAPAPRVEMNSFVQNSAPYQYVGFRRDDIQTLRRWRNAQIAVLRQKKPLTHDDQERWFRTVVTPTHQSAEPSFLLVSILDDTQSFIGYGGLTNIDWDRRRAEVSFLVDPARAENDEVYRQDYLHFLRFLQSWAFDTLGLHRPHTETYAFRAKHMEILEEAGFCKEGRLIDHIEDPFSPGDFMDSILHGIVATSR